MKKCALLLCAVVLGFGAVVHAQMPRAGSPQMPSPQPATPSQNGSPSVQENVPFATIGGHELMLDVYLPGDLSTDLRPAIVLIHGGGWISFDKSTMRAMGSFLSRSGFVAFAVDYRLFNGKENLWPAQLDDVQRAVRWIRANAPKYRVDPDHIGAFGHSAGAQLAALLGMEDTRDNSDTALAKFSSRVQAVVDVSGPTDFTANHEADRDEFYSSFLGADYAHAPKIWEDASPAFHVSKKDAPFLIFHGTKDDSVPMAQAQELAEKLKHVKVPVKLVTVDDGHTFATEAVRRQLALESRDFFFQYLRPGVR